MKRVFIFIFLMFGFVIGFMNFSKPINAMIHNGVDYRFLETGTPLEINGVNYHPIVINEDYGGARLLDWLNYMQVNNLNRVTMTASKISTFYIYYDTTMVGLSQDVFKMELNYDSGSAYFYATFYYFNEIEIDRYIFANTETNWEVPSSSRILTDINFQETDDVYSKGYNKGYWEGKNDGYSKGLDDGYDKGFDDGYDETMFNIFHNGFNVDSGYDQTESRPYIAGFNAGIEKSTDFSFTSLLAQIFTGLGSFLAIQLLPNISIGAIIAVPIVFGIIAFIIGKRGGKGD